MKSNLLNDDSHDRDLRAAFEAGVLHAVKVMQQLQEMAERDAAERAYLAAAEAQGPQGLKPHFEEIFGTGRPAA